MDEPRPTLPDWAYPVEALVPESTLHLDLRTMLLLLVRHYLSVRGIRAFTGSDQFLYWVEGNPQQSLAPDVYVIVGEDPRRSVRSWMTWREGRAPDLAVEIVSDDWPKDYEEGPRKYAEAGVRELVIFDPLDGPSRVRWQVYRRDEAGDLVLVFRSDGDRVRSDVLDCYLRWLPDEPALRLADGPSGDHLVPSAEEHERAEKDRALADKERALADKERALAERNRALADKKDAEARIRALEAELAARREPGDRS